MQQRGRIEIANHAGTPEQDAFMGCKLGPIWVQALQRHVRTDITLR